VGRALPTISQSWLERWEQITPFLAYPQEVRRVIYTTDEIVKAARSDSAVFVLLGSGAACVRGGSLAGRDVGETGPGWPRLDGAN
jgi:putative transposase